MIGYRTVSEVECVVLVEGKVTGTIRPHEDGFAYFVKGSNSRGAVFPTIRDVKRSLEEDDEEVGDEG